MLTRLNSAHLCALAFVTLVGCSGTHEGGTDAGRDTSVASAGPGCCPIADFTGCSPGSDPLPAGGWAADVSQCGLTISGFDGQPYTRSTDMNGCPILVMDNSVPACGTPLVDAGPPPDAGSDVCTPLSITECFGNPFDCAPAFDDSCCPSCTDGPCADCSHPVYLGCRERADGCGNGCATSPQWGCGPAGVDCSAAVVVDETTCDAIGCVPATEPVGSPMLDVECVPVTHNSCTVACRRIAPNCPAGTAPEGDGQCYTDRCIPAWVCE